MKYFGEIPLEILDDLMLSSFWFFHEEFVFLRQVFVLFLSFFVTQLKLLRWNDNNSNNNKNSCSQSFAKKTIFLFLFRFCSNWPFRSRYILRTLGNTLFFQSKQFVYWRYGLDRKQKVHVNKHVLFFKRSSLYLKG